MKNVCKALGYFEAISGLIGSFILAKIFGVSTELSVLSVRTERDWLLTIVIFVSCLFSVAVLSAILLGIAEILENLETSQERYVIDQGATASRKILEEEERTFWKCPQCGKNNPPYTGTCSCGCAKE